MTLQAVDFETLNPGDTVHVKLAGDNEVWLTRTTNSVIKWDMLHGVHTNASNALLDPRGNVVAQRLQLDGQLFVNHTNLGKITALGVNP